MNKFGVEELDWHAQSPDLKLIEHLCFSHPTSVSERMVKNSLKLTPKTFELTFLEELQLI